MEIEGKKEKGKEGKEGGRKMGTRGRKLTRGEEQKRRKMKKKGIR